MEVKPVGRERDRQIEGLRLLETVHFLKGNNNSIPHYSTSLTDAWKLWKEMKGDHPELLVRSNHIRCYVFKDTVLVRYYGDTEADAISGAWVMWKAGENG